MRKIKSILYNWFYTAEAGEEYVYFEVGKEKPIAGCLSATKIVEGETKDKTYYDIYFDNGTIERVFNASQVTYYNEEEK